MACRIHLCNARFLVLGVFLEGITDVFIGYASVFPEETDYLASAARLEVEVVHCRHTTNGTIGVGLGEASLCGRHDDGLSFLKFAMCWGYFCMQLRKKDLGD